MPGSPELPQLEVDGPNLQSLREQLSTPEGRKTFREGIERGMETYSQITRDELPPQQRPEFQLPEGEERRLITQSDRELLGEILRTSAEKSNERARQIREALSLSPEDLNREFTI